jgi:hypothetical protein
MLADDKLRGRDTGSDGYRDAARYVVSQLSRAGLDAAGESGYYQTVPLHSVHFATERSTVEFVRPNGQIRSLQWQREITIIPRVGTPAIFDAPLGFTGWETPASLVSGRILAALAAAFRAGGAERLSRQIADHGRVRFEAVQGRPATTARAPR